MPSAVTLSPLDEVTTVTSQRLNGLKADAAARGQSQYPVEIKGVYAYPVVISHCHVSLLSRLRNAITCDPLADPSSGSVL